MSLQMTFPELPYAGTSGHSGSDTSKARAVDSDRKGKTARRQLATLEFAQDSGTHGITWKELSVKLGLHHGSASGVLSVLHKTGHLIRLVEARNGCKVYVTPKYVANRPTELQGRKKCCPHCGGSL